jgi:acyl carrier protein
MPTVDRVLTIFCDAFMFDEHHKYKFAPEDDVTIIYRNAIGPIGDDFQYEELVMGIEEAFGIDLVECNWSENFTLGHLVRMVLESRKADRRGDGT